MRGMDCDIENRDAQMGTASEEKSKRDFSLRRPTLSQEAKAEEKIGLLRSK